MNDIVLKTARETAEILRVSTSTLTRLTQKGVIVGRRIGGKIMYTPSDIEAYLEKAKTTLPRRNYGNEDS